MFDMEKWWGPLSAHLPLPGKIADFAALVGRYNKALSLGFVGNIAAVTLPPNSNRVAIAVGANYILNNTLITADLQFLDASLTTVWATRIMAHEGDVAAVTPSPIQYTPLFISVLDLGPLIQFRLNVNQTGPINVFVAEILINPSLDGQVA